MNFIIVGSNFPGFYDNSIPDTFIFPRNSIMIQPVGVAATDTLVDFKNSQD